jgi:4-diphosphocytidyl-2-C-methyl-D-erythritol kinase
LPALLVENAPAKVNLTLRVLGRRADGYHDLDSLVVFAGCADRLSLAPGGVLALTVDGPRAGLAGDTADNLVLKAARAVAARIPDLVLGAFKLEKSLPVAAGLGGGSADAAAALRLIARANDLRPDDPRLYEAARATGADVPVCLDPRPRVMGGIGERLSEALTLPPLPAVLVNPGAAVPTKQVFAGWTPKASTPMASTPMATTVAALDVAALAKVSQQKDLLRIVAAQPNDLESSAIAVAPVIADVLAALRALSGCGLARMSGSGATCFGLFSSVADAAAAAKALAAKYPDWWVCETTLG